MPYRSELLYEYAKNNIRDKDVWPVFVPSYNRPEATLLKRLYSELEFPIVFCVFAENRRKCTKHIRASVLSCFLTE